jgi:hypothetical protein
MFMLLHFYAAANIAHIQNIVYNSKQHLEKQQFGILPRNCPGDDDDDDYAVLLSCFSSSMLFMHH